MLFEVDFDGFDDVLAISVVEGVVDLLLSEDGSARIKAGEGLLEAFNGSFEALLRDASLNGGVESNFNSFCRWLVLNQSLRSASDRCLNVSF